MELSQAFNRRKFFLRLVSSFVLVSVKSASGSASATTHKQKEERVKDMNPAYFSTTVQKSFLF